MQKSTKKQLNRLIKLLAVIFTLGITSCTTLQTNPDNLVWLPVPDPIVNGVEIVTEENGVVKMPSWYWQKVQIYIIVTEGNKEKLK